MKFFFRPLLFASLAVAAALVGLISFDTVQAFAQEIPKATHGLFETVFHSVLVTSTPIWLLALAVAVTIGSILLHHRRRRSEAADPDDGYSDVIDFRRQPSPPD